MVRCKYYEFVIIQLVYVTRKNKQNVVTWDRTNPSGAPQQAFNWYSEAYYAETATLPPDTLIRYKEWRIYTCDANLFTVHDFRYDQCYVFLGADSWYWIFFQNDPGTRRYQGRLPLQFSHCGCCISRQYHKILRRIKAYAEKDQ